MELVPQSFAAKVLPRTGQPEPLEPGMYQAVHFIMASENREWILGKIEQWFDDRDDVILVATGESQKHGLGFIVLEWDGVEIDPLFLSILQHDEMVADFTVYDRSEEV